MDEKHTRGVLSVQSLHQGIGRYPQLGIAAVNANVDAGCGRERRSSPRRHDGDDETDQEQSRPNYGREQHIPEILQSRIAQHRVRE
jgi:hypothetical protein